MKNYKTYNKDVLTKLQQSQFEILKDFIKVCEKYNLTYFMYAGSAIGVVRHQGFIPWDDDIDVAMPRKDYDKFLEIYAKEIGEKYKILTPIIDSRYTASVTHLQKKGTKFISEVSKDLKADLCIDIDIFPYDYIPKNEKDFDKQIRKTKLLYRLLFLVGHKKPLIPYQGIKKGIAQVLCLIIHYSLKFFRVSGKFLYVKADQISRKYNNKEHSNRLVNFESAVPKKSYLYEDEIFPLVKGKFNDIEVNLPNGYDAQLRRIFGDYMQVPPEDKRINHAPYLIDFGDGDIVKMD